MEQRLQSVKGGFLKKVRSIAIMAVSAFAAQSVCAQEFPISNGDVTSCTGAFLDSGANPSNYGNNENFTATICPDGTGPAISLQWILFNLSTAGSSPVDEMSIYDGASTADPLIGTWSGSNSPGIISASFANTSGCLTVVFTSNGTGTGNFAAAISCFQPCEPPTAVAVMNEPAPLLACQGETITFDATGSFAAAGFSISEYKWDFADDVLDSLTGPVVQHAFTDPGEYVVQLYLTDDNECASTNLVDLQVLVSTTPIFSGTTPSTTICQGDVVSLTTDPTAVQWSAVPETTLGGGIFLPDLLGVPFTTGLTFNNFSPNQTLNDVSGLQSICVSMEHSYMGDLVISIACPNGQSMDFHQQGGGSTFLGVPVDNDATPDIQGTCFQYCWDPFATNGTWAQNTGGTLPAGTYQSVEPFTELIGCPLNGTWTLTVVDLFGSDNGFICDWEINFDPALFPSLTEFTPVLGVNTPDSASWTGNSFTPDPNDPLSGVAAPSVPGVYPYIFSVTDNFGCTYDTTITVTVTPSPQGPITIVGDSVICEDGIAYLVAPAGFDTYLWSPGGFTGTNVNVGAGVYTVTVAYGSCPLLSEPFTVTEAPNPVPVITGANFSCGGVPVLLSTTTPFSTYVWSTTATTSTISATTGSYTVTVTNAEGCSVTSDPFNVLVANDPTAAFNYTPLTPQPMGTSIDFVDLSSGNGGSIVSWNWTFGEPGSSSTVPSPEWTYNNPGDYVVTLIVTTADGCVDTVTTVLGFFPPEIEIPNVITPNGDGYNEAFDITNIEYWTNELRIYSRWGNKVYEARNYKNQWKADELADGTYFYELQLGDGRNYSGHITVLR